MVGWVHSESRQPMNQHNNHTVTLFIPRKVTNALCLFQHGQITFLRFMYTTKQLKFETLTFELLQVEQGATLFTFSDIKTPP